MLRKIVLVLVLIFNLSALYSQCGGYFNACEKPIIKHHSLYVALQPFDYGLGLRYDYTFNHVGLYTSISYGNYWLNSDHTQYIKDHVKYTLGLLYQFPKEYYAQWLFTANTALNYHTIGSYEVDQIYNINDMVLHNQLSFELGCTVKFKCFALGVRTDILRWEPCFDIGLSF